MSTHRHLEDSRPRACGIIITTDAQMNRWRRIHKRVAGPRLLAHVPLGDQEPSPEHVVGRLLLGLNPQAFLVRAVGHRHGRII